MNKYVQILKDHIWGPTGSIVFHLIILFVLVRFVVVEGPVQDEAVVEIEMDVVPPPEDLEEIEFELEEFDDTPDVVDTVEIPVVSPDTEPPAPDALDVDPTGDLGDDGIPETVSPVTFRNLSTRGAVRPPRLPRVPVVDPDG